MGPVPNRHGVAPGNRLRQQSPVPVRPATPGDVPALLPMVAALTALHEGWDPERYDMLPDVLERYARWLPQRAVDQRSVLLVTEEPGAGGRAAVVVAGFLVATVERNIPISRRAEYGFIHDLWVEPAFRRRGLARALVLAALDRFRALGVTQVRLETAGANEPARRLFASCGFRVGTVDMLLELPAGAGQP
jgi:ribosomal protein S18 acetylase RimI-like enzyme